MANYPGQGGMDTGAWVSGQSIYQLSRTIQHGFGNRIVLGERVFRYMGVHEQYTGGVIQPVTAGQLVGSLSSIGSVDLEEDIAAGDKYIDIQDDTFDDVPKNILAGGMLGIRGGVSHCYRIRGNDENTSAGVVRVYIFDSVVAAQASADDIVTVTPNLYRMVHAREDSEHIVPVGVAMAASDADNLYGWFQTWGPCMVQTSSTSISGIEMIADDTAGQIVPATGASGHRARVGIGMASPAAAGRAMVYLQLSA